MSQPPAAGTFIRRKRDGMLGLVGRTWGYQLSAAQRHVQTDVTWLGEWTVGQLNKAGPYDVLTGSDEAAARQRFDALFCARCGGSGKLDPFTRCEEPRCRSGRVLGVEPAFDASHAAYERLIAREIERERHRYGRRGHDDGEQRMDLRYPATCTECGARLEPDTTALGRKEGGSWRFRCLLHASAA